MWSSPLTQGIKIGLRLSQDRVPIVFYDRPPIQAEAMTFFFFFFLLVKLSIPNQTGYIRGVQYCNRVCIWMFLVRYIMTGCIFRAPSAIWQGQVLTPPAAPPIQLRSRVPPPPREKNPNGCERAERASRNFCTFASETYLVLLCASVQYEVQIVPPPCQFSVLLCWRFFSIFFLLVTRQGGQSAPPAPPP